MLSWLARVVQTPWVVNILVPTLSQALANFFTKQADKLELSNAVRVAKAAQTRDELRLASERLARASRRN